MTRGRRADRCLCRALVIVMTITGLALPGSARPALVIPARLAKPPAPRARAVQGIDLRGQALARPGPTTTGADLPGGSSSEGTPTGWPASCDRNDPRLEGEATAGENGAGSGEATEWVAWPALLARQADRQRSGRAASGMLNDDLARGLTKPVERLARWNLLRSKAAPVGLPTSLCRLTC